MRLTNTRCLCRACGERFNCISMFNRHRAGSYDITAPRCGRRCLTVDEMRARGFSTNAAGFWIERARLDGARRRRDRFEPLVAAGGGP